MHVTQRGNNRGKIFHDDQDRIRYLDFLSQAADACACDVNCYALMGNHVHLLMTPTESNSLPAALHRLNTRYVMYFNRKHGRTGGLWEGRYHSSQVDDDGYLKMAYRYIELNPVKDGYCERPTDFRWSSHRYHALGAPDRVVTPHRAYLYLGDTPTERQTRYRKWFLGSDPIVR